MPRLLLIAVGVLLAYSQGLAQATTNRAAVTATNVTPIPAPEASEKAWAFSAYVYSYLVPDSRDYVQPTLTADYGWLHLEARYNYESHETASVWIGYNLSFGDKLTIDFTPMLGGAFGDTTGIAPGYKATLGWRMLELATEGEYLIDTGDSSENFFYTWSELSISPVDWLRLGVVVQRTKLYETDFDIQRGFLVGFSYKRLDVATYVFNPDDEPTFVFAVGLNF